MFATSRPQEFADLPRRSLGSLDRNVAAETFGDDDVGSALADAVALHEADEFELRQVLPRSNSAASRISSPPLISSTPILSRPTVGRSRPNNTRAIALPITASAIKWCASPPMVAPTSSITESPRMVGHIPAIAGLSIPGSMRS